MAEADLSRDQDRTAGDIRSWLVGRIAHYLKQPAGEIDPNLSLAEYGMDSLCAFSLCADVESELGVLIEPTLFWNVDTVAELTAYIAGLSAKQPPD